MCQFQHNSPRELGLEFPGCLTEWQWGNGDIISLPCSSSALLAHPAVPQSQLLSPQFISTAQTDLKPGEIWELSASLLCFYFSKSFPCPAFPPGCELTTKSIQSSHHCSQLDLHVKGTVSAKFTPNSLKGSISMISASISRQRGSGNVCKPHNIFVDTGIIH